MTFVNPLLLAGAALVVVPIVLHLIMRRKPRHLEFPALRLVQLRHETNRRRLRLRHLLLLALRVAAIAILAMALARPSLKFSGVLGSREAPVAAVLVFDTAPRMQYRLANRTRLEEAQEMGRWLLRQLPGESRIGVLDTRLGPGAFQVDRGAAADRIDRLGSVANSQPLADVLDEAFRLLATSELERKEVYVFTDLARAAWPADTAARIEQHVAEMPGASLYLVDVGVREPEDYSLGELRLSAQLLSSRSPLDVRTELARTGPAGQRAVELYLLDENRQPQKRDHRDLTLEAGGSAEIPFQIGALKPGTHQGFVRIVGQDNLSEDDTRYFTIEVAPAWRILVVDPESAHSYAGFLAQILAPETLRKSGQARFECDVTPQRELAERDLQPYSAVCLVHPTPIAPDAWEKLGQYAASGHGLAVFLGRNASPVETFNQSEAQKLLPGLLLREARSPEVGVLLAPRDLEHPMLRPFREMTGSIPWSDSPIYRYWELGSIAKGVNVVVPFDDGRPAVLERTVGDGRVVTMTTPVSDRAQGQAWNLLPTDSWPFFILSHQMMLYLVGSTDARLNYMAGQTAVVPLDSAAPFRSYLLTAPGDTKFPLSADPKQNALLVSATDEVGNYRVQAGGRASGVDRGFSVNLASRQTELTRLTKDELAGLFGDVPFRLARNQNEIERDVSMARVGRELFSPLILLLAVLLAAECLLANRFYREGA
jgi:hypothetical protein